MRPAHTVRAHLEKGRSRSAGRRLATFTAAAAALALALTACAGSESPAPGSEGGEAVHGESMSVGVQQAPANLDPGTLDKAFTDFTMLAYDPLFYMSPEGEVQPRLAESWEYVGDGNTELHVKIREGVTFSDGDALDAAAVKGSLEYARDSNGSHSFFLKDMTFEATDEFDLTITSTTPNPLIPNVLTQVYPIGQIISPTGLKDPSALTLEGESHGAGQYVYDAAASVIGDHFTYKVNPDYWNTDIQYWDEITYKVVANHQAALNAAKTDQIKVFKGDLTIAQQATSAGLQVVANPAILTGLYLTDRNGEVTPALGDVKVRQAINFAIDRESVTEALLGEYGEPTFQTSIEGADGYSEASADYYSYDPEKAKELLAEAGYPDGFDLTITTAVFAGFEPLGEAIKSQLAEVGITVTTDVKSDIGSYVDAVTGGESSAFVGGFSAAPMYQQGIDFWLPGSNFYNPFGIEPEELTALWNEAAAAGDDARAPLDAEMQDYLVENAWNAPVMFAPAIYFAREEIGGVATSAGAPFASPFDWHLTE